jgi:4-hydroxyphenylpyruvate dioxygenase
METAEQLATDTGKDLFEIHGTHHVHFYVGNAKQSAYYYRRAFGFELIGYSGPETGVRETASYALKQGKIVLVLTTPLTAEHPANDFLRKHGDGVRDISLTVSDAEEAFKITTERGAKPVQEPHTISDDNGTVRLATVSTYGEVVHTFVEKTDNYNGVFLPGFRATPKDELAQSVGLKHVDHIVGNMDWNQMDATVEFYKKVFGFARFVSFDDNDISTDYTALKSTVVANENKWIKFPINEPAEGKRQSQIEEYIKFNNGPGVQHIAMESHNIIEAVTQMRANGVEFLDTPDSYYDMLAERVGEINEDIEDLRRLKILVDKDDKGYMLQIFTKPVEDRPTLFIEIIQRRGGESFGKGNFKALFESIEREQELRGNL